MVVAIIVQNHVINTFKKLKINPTCNPSQTNITRDMLAYPIKGHISR